MHGHVEVLPIKGLREHRMEVLPTKVVRRGAGRRGAGAASGTGEQRGRKGIRLRAGVRRAAAGRRIIKTTYIDIHSK